ncbi:MAG: hypothetical protein LBQ50_08640 [Planctomycetaceae bacterium]|nr:hypothetical protein [Planctomycetaceae bacterium]
MVALFCLPIATHQFIIRLPAKPFEFLKHWRFRQSVAVAGLLCAFIIATISMVICIHEVYWLTHPKEPVTKKVAVDWMKHRR